MYKNVLYYIVVIKDIHSRRLSELGLIRGTIFRIVKRVAGMVQLKFGGNDIVIREETLEDITYDED